jgi:anthranilate phosphoribosyltransferase
MKEILNRLFEYKSLDRATAREILSNLAQGKYNNSEMAAFLTVYLMRNITVEELSGFRDAMLELCVPLHIENTMPSICAEPVVMEKIHLTFLHSLPSLLQAPDSLVAKHGNNSVSSVCGSSNVLAYFGYEFTNDSDILRRSLENANICYLHAPLFHPAMKNVAPVRKELGVKTFFNMLGPW